MAHPGETSIDTVPVPSSQNIIKRIRGFYLAVGFHCQPLQNDRGVQLTPPHIDPDSSALYYLFWDSTAIMGGYSLRGANDPTIKSRWHQGFGRSTVSERPDATLTLPTNVAVLRTYAAGGELLVASCVNGLAFTPNRDARYEFFDPVYNRILVTSDAQ